MNRIPCPSESADRYFADQESAAEEACYSTAAKYGVTPEQADHCDDGAIGCLSCPFRDPSERPVTGDRLRLHNGTLIEVWSVLDTHVRGPRVEYEIVNWRRGWGGRKRYILTMAAWKKKTSRWMMNPPKVERHGPASP